MQITDLRWWLALCAALVVQGMASAQTSTEPLATPSAAASANANTDAKPKPNSTPVTVVVEGLSAKQAEAPAPKPPQVTIRCVLVRDRSLLKRLFGGFGADDDDSMDCRKRQAAKPQELIGLGDLELLIEKADYDLIIGHEQRTGQTMVLYVNGVALPHDAQLAAVEQIEGETHLRYRINQGEDTQVLWSSLYRDKGLLRTDTLRTALGWNASDPGNSYLAPPRPQTPSKLNIAITSGLAAFAAFATITVLLLAILVMAWKTDAFRDASTPTWYTEAARIRAQLQAAGADQEQILKSIDTTWDATQRQYYVETAEAALDGTAPPENRPRLVPIGLALGGNSLRPLPATYSLARVQMGLWFAFAIAAGLFLWIIYGQLRRIDGSLLGLLAISVGTTGMSLGVDRNAGGRPYIRSKGLFLDLVTGFDDAHQVHRYQAVVVNLLLLFVAVSHVLQQLTYPILDPTWLALLGLSGAALGLGKQVLEKPVDPPLPAPLKKPAAGAPPVQPAADGSVG
jgi:hypothetical protein